MKPDCRARRKPRAEALRQRQSERETRAQAGGAAVTEEARPILAMGLFEAQAQSEGAPCTSGMMPPKNEIEPRVKAQAS
jgi:hypothetical protein